MEFKLETSLPPPSEQRIAWFEKTYRVTLPHDYVEVLRTGNGATPLTSLFYQSGRERLIEKMLCLLENPRNELTNGWADITVVMSQLDSRLIDDEDLVGMNVIPFATLFGGDFLCLDYRNSQIPVVAIWDHEKSDEFQPHLDKIANTFREFDEMVRQP